VASVLAPEGLGSPPASARRQCSSGKNLSWKDEATPNCRTERQSGYVRCAPKPKRGLRIESRRSTLFQVLQPGVEYFLDAVSIPPIREHTCRTKRWSNTSNPALI